ncbi:MAG: site-2 protease family protein [Planctomycetota bacterium]|nr:site-2 protease family protein [Planctomycetota bacterium]
MKWSLKLATVKGLAIYVHWTFILIIAWVVFVYASQGRGAAQILEGIVFVLAIFGCVILHELGHALTALRFGVKTRDIILLPIGGVARLQRMPDKPGEELVVAVAGPLVNVTIALILLPVVLFTGQLSEAIQSVTDLQQTVAQAQQSGVESETAARDAAANIDIPFLVNLLFVNIFLVVFNMIPAFPMDGGRVLRSLLAMTLPYVQATRIAAMIGQFIAIGFAILGIFWNPFLLLIALFVFVGAAGEAQMAVERTAVEGLRAADAMMTRFRVLTERDTVAEAARELLAGDQQDFPVAVDNQVIGILSRSEMMRALASGDSEGSVADHANRACRPAEENESLIQVVQRMREARCSALPVLRGSQIVGLLTLDNVAELTMVRNALDRHRERNVLPDRLG